jgi:hypothetical protein
MVVDGFGTRRLYNGSTDRSGVPLSGAIMVRILKKILLNMEQNY